MVSFNFWSYYHIGFKAGQEKKKYIQGDEKTNLNREQFIFIVKFHFYEYCLALSRCERVVSLFLCFFLALTPPGFFSMSVGFHIIS